MAAPASASPVASASLRDRGAVGAVLVPGRPMLGCGSMSVWGWVFLSPIWLFSIFGCSSWTDPSIGPVDPVLDAAWRSLDAGDPLGVLHHLDGRGAGVDSPLSEACLRQDALCGLGREPEAWDEAQRRMEERGDADAHVLLARLLEDHEAKSELLRALEWEPSHPYAHLGLGTLAARGGDLEAADREFTAALESELSGDPGVGRTRALLFRRRGEVRARVGDFEGAESDLAGWLRRRPGDVATRMSRALILHEHLDRGDEAEAEYRLVLDVDPDNPGALVGLAVRSESRGELDTAERLYLMASGREPTAWFNLGLLYMNRLGRPEDARACFERFLAQDHPGVDAADRILYAPNLIQELDQRAIARDPDEL